ncbi:dioxygenase [Pseudanabaena sp. UWO311]|uniref:DODA-type extradiol aromatic ring-opening family dioxygenase n=1 Tax=Pseudanabaena sp. UWO311 TaxID=2487337 RepID=UPI001158561D|nr:class III extradiol ring-cleavage dioxygenase [Pseudanabaena sp. UWO311]TYQ28698.1 dioxygenase [Pseudanabaena sp. UWO311]
MITKTDRKIILPTYFISHGGGPWPWMRQEMSGLEQLEASLQAIPKEIEITPKAVLVISAHWEERNFTVMSSAAPPMLYDYSGFPEHTYRIQYSALGSPSVASRIQELLQKAGFQADSDQFRGFDHGVFVPMFVAYPEANVPILQLSIRADYDPAAHIAVGRAIAPLRNEGVLIIGSGLTYHNLSLMIGQQAKASSHLFDEWLTNVVCGSKSDERNYHLVNWSQAPSARIAHPREDHLVPLFVAVGAAEMELGDRIYHEEKFFGGITVSSFRFGEKTVF